MTTRRDIERLIEETLSAHRPTDARGEMRFHPAWHDLDESSRHEVFVQLTRARILEAAQDAEQLSTTAHAVLRRIRGV
jgi:hypothetical protein